MMRRFTADSIQSASPADAPTARETDWVFATALFAAFGILGCADRSAVPTPDSVAEGAAEPAPETQSDGFTDPDEALAAEMAALNLLGYVDYSAPVEGELGPGGVVEFDAERSRGGYRLITDVPGASAVLIDIEGNELANWELTGAAGSDRFEVLGNGNVLGMGRAGAEWDSEWIFRQQTFGGDPVWSQSFRAHHDFDELASGEFFTLLELGLSVHGEIEDRQFIDQGVARIAADGTLIDQVSVYDLLVDKVEELGLIFDRDLLHLNSVEGMPWPELSARGPLYDPDNVLVSVRNQNLLVIFNWRTREVVWSWGKGELRRQHEATWLANGNLLAFCNGDDERPWSRAVEIDPAAREVVWEYRADPPESLFSQTRGTAEELPGGNVLIGNSNVGEALEVTRDGDVVWRYLIPRLGPNGGRAAIRVKHYEPELIEPLLERRGEPGR